jgi:predicted transglutaminase-like cysteine proteinase
MHNRASYQLKLGVFFFAILGSGGLPAPVAAQYTGNNGSNFTRPPNDLFGTAPIFAPLGRYREQWERARQSAVGNPRLQALVEPARGLGQLQQIAFVQDRVHRQIRWISDATEWGRHDYWASASETLSHGAGDMEDRAVVKMQALIALGFNPGDLFLTLGRDKVGGPISLLVVRLRPGRYLTLDDLGGAPVSAARREGFTPTMSLSTTGQWLHGYRVATMGAGGR